MNTDTQTNFSIHTFEMKRRLTHRDYEDYFNHLQKCLPEDIRHKDKAKKHKIIFSNTGKELKGVNRIELIRCTSYGYKVYYATFIINPRMLLNRDHPHLRIISPNQLNLIPGALDEIMRKAIPSWLPSLEAGFYDVETEGIPIDIITRIDYCTNVKFETYSDVVKYIKILKAGSGFRNFKQVILDTVNKDCANPVLSQQNLNRFVIKNQSSCFEAYSKYAEMNSKKYYCEEETAESASVLRMEYRPRRSKISSLREKYGIKSEISFLLSSPYIAEKEIPNMLKSMYGTGDFYPLSQTLSIISEYPSLTKHDRYVMTAMVNYVHDYRLLTHNHDSQISISDRQWKKYIKIFNELGINVITCEEGSRYMNPIRLIKTRNVNYG